MREHRLCHTWIGDTCKHCGIKYESPSVEQDERGAFESWASRYTKFPENYDNIPAWLAWQARAASTSANSQDAAQAELFTAQRDAAYAALDAVLEFAQQWGEWTVGKQLEALLLKHGVHPREHERCAFCGAHVESPCESAPVDTCEKALEATYPPKEYRLAGVWEPDGSKFKTYRAEDLRGKEMYVKEPV